MSHVCTTVPTRNGNAQHVDTILKVNSTRALGRELIINVQRHRVHDMYRYV